jgi:hypothetical protein
MEQAGAAGTPPGPVSEDKPFYRRASFWTGPFMLGIGLLVGVILGIGWYTLGGFPRDHDKYGEVAVPGQAVLALPEGDVRLNFENHATRSGDTTSIDDQPAGLDVQVTPAAGGDGLEVEDVPSWIFSSTSGDRGHEPWAKLDVPSAGDYLLRTSAEGLGGPTAPAAAGAAAPEAPSVDSGAAISVGQSPWTPLDSKFLGAVLCAVAVVLLLLLLTLPLRLFIPRD